METKSQTFVAEDIWMDTCARARARALNPLLIIRVGNEGNFEVKDIEPCQVKADKNHVLCF